MFDFFRGLSGAEKKLTTGSILLLISLLLSIINYLLADQNVSIISSLLVIPGTALLVVGAEDYQNTVIRSRKSMTPKKTSPEGDVLKT